YWPPSSGNSSTRAAAAASTAAAATRYARRRGIDGGTNADRFTVSEADHREERIVIGPEAVGDAPHAHRLHRAAREDVIERGVKAERSAPGRRAVVDAGRRRERAPQAIDRRLAIAAPRVEVAAEDHRLPHETVDERVGLTASRLERTAVPD